MSGFAAADSQQGKILAQRWCVACHQISLEQPVVTVDVPSFMAIARKHEKDIHVLEGFLSHPHSVMPDWNLSRQEIRDIVDFIASFK
jgi:mono/diheme cytochrome c family protein